MVIIALFLIEPASDIQTNLVIRTISKKVISSNKQLTYFQNRLLVETGDRFIFDTSYQWQQVNGTFLKQVIDLKIDDWHEQVISAFTFAKQQFYMRYMN